MKQTNNAIKFLLAQYRAIFKHAYLKGLAASVVLTTALAAGATTANAAGTISGGSTSWATASDGLVSSGDVTFDATTSGSKYFNNLTISPDSTFNIKSPHASTIGSGGISIVNTMTVNGTVNVGSGTSGASIFGWNNADLSTYQNSTGDIVVASGGELNVGNNNIGHSTVQMNVVTLESGSTTNLVASGTSSSVWDLGAQLIGGYGESGSVNIQSGSNLNVGAHSMVVAASSSTMNVDGNVTLNGSTSGTAVLRGTDNYGSDGNFKATTTNAIINIKSNANINASGSSAIFAPETNMSGGKIKVASNATFTLDGDMLETTKTWSDAEHAAGIFNISDTAITVSGTLSIGNGEYKSDDTQTSLNEKGLKTTVTMLTGSLEGAGTVAVSGSLVIDNNILSNFAKTGKATLASGSVTTLVSENDKAIDLGAYTFSGSSDSNFFTVTDGATLQGVNLKVAQALTGSDATNLDVKAEDTFTFGSSSYSGGDKLFKTVAAKNLAFDSTDAFKLVDNVTLSSTRSITSGGSEIEVSDNGTITGDVTVSGGKVLVNGGNYTADDSITLASGSLTVQGTDAVANLTLNDNFVLDNTSGANTILISGSNDKTATLDISDATLSVSGSTGANVTTLTVSGSGATLISNGDNIETLLASEADTKSGSVISVKDGTVEVSGNLELTDNQLVSTINSQASGSLALSGTAKLIVAETLTITSGDGTLNIGTGSIEASTLTLNNATGTGTKTSTLGSGSYTVLNGLRTANTSDTVALSTGSILNLGKLDANGNAVGGGNLAAITNNAGILNVKAGTWSGSTLTAATGSKVDVTKNATLTLDKLTASGNTTTVSGNLTVNGITNNGDTKGTGLILAKDSITLTGNLTLGAGVADDITFTDDKLSDGTGITQGAINIQGGTLKIDFASGSTLDSNKLISLKEQLFSNVLDNGTIDGTLDIGAAKIAELDLGTKDENGRYNFDKVAGVSDVTTGGVTNDQLTQNAFTTTDGSNIAGTVGAIHVTGGDTASIKNTAAFVNSDTNGGYFVSTSGSSGDTAANIDFAGSTLRLENGGEAGNVTVSSNGGTLLVKSSADAKTILGDVTATSGTFDVQGPTTAEKVDVSSLKLSEGNSLQANSLNVSTTDAVTLDGALNVVSGSATFASTNGVTLNATTTVAKNLSTSGDLVLAGTTNVGQDLTVNGDLDVQADTTVKSDVDLSGDATVANGAKLVAQKVELTKDKILNIGLDTTTNTDGTVSNDGSTGFLQTEHLVLNGGTLIVDPSYGESASIAIIGKVGTTSNDPTVNGGVLDGNVVAAQNGIAALGVTDATEALAPTEIRGIFSSLLNANNSLSKDNVGAIVYVGQSIEVNDGSRLIADASATSDSAVKDLANTPDSKYYAYDAYIGKNSALAIDEDALTSDGINGAVHFDSTGAQLYNAGGTVLLVGDGFNTRDSINLFTDNGKTAEDTNGVKIVGNSLEVKTINGLFHLTYEAGYETTAKKLSLDTEQVKYVFNDASAPVKNSLIAYAARDNNWAQEGQEGYEADQLHGDLLTNLSYDATNNIFYKTNDESKAPVSGSYVAIKGEDGKYQVFESAYNSFLDYVVTHEMSGRSAEQAARLAVFGGAAQAALSAGATTYDAISGRMGVGAQTGSITFADNGQGAGLWVTPVYKNHDSDGFSAQGASYGVDMDMYGVALGGDFTLANGLRVGAAFNVGSGDADGQGTGAGVSNDFDYYGFAVYGGFTYDKLSIVGDISYTVVDNDVEANTAVEKLTASMDSANLSVGVTGQYSFDYNGLSIVPHAGLRYTNIDLDDYTVKGSEDVAHFDGDSVNVFSIPVGVTFSKEFTAGDWSIQPAFDLTLTANMGDDSIEGTVAWAGINNMNTKVESEVLDDWTYGATLGVAAKSGNLSLGFGVNYTGASSADEYGVGANARFVF